MTEDEERAAFEKDLLNYGGTPDDVLERDEYGDYKYEWVDDRWDGWKARGRVGQPVEVKDSDAFKEEVRRVGAVCAKLPAEEEVYVAEIFKERSAWINRCMAALSNAKAQREALKLARDTIKFAYDSFHNTHDEAFANSKVGVMMFNTQRAIDNLLSSQSENNCKDAKHPQVMKGE